MEINITKAVIYQSKGTTDRVDLTIDLPSPFAHLGENSLRLTFETPVYKGPAYVQEHFKIEPTIHSFDL